MPRKKEETKVKPKIEKKPSVAKEPESPLEKVEATPEEVKKFQKEGRLVGWDGKYAVINKEVT